MNLGFNYANLTEPYQLLYRVVSNTVNRDGPRPITFTGLPATDLLIMHNLSDEDLTNICFVNSYTHRLCNNESFWFNRLYRIFGRPILDARPANESWLQYYITLMGNNDDTIIMSNNPTLFAGLDLGQTLHSPLSKLLAVGINGVANVKELLSIIRIFYKLHGVNNESDIIVQHILNSIIPIIPLPPGTLKVMTTRLLDEQALLDHTLENLE